MEMSESASSTGSSSSQPTPLVQIYDEGCAQYMLVGEESHHLFYAALIDGRAKTLRCRTVAEEPANPLEDAFGNTFEVSEGVW